MKISSYKKSEKALFTALTVLMISTFVSFVCELFFDKTDFWNVVLTLFFGVASVIFILIDVLVLSSKTILRENGIAYKNLFRNRFFGWDEIKFIASYEITFRYTLNAGILCSLDLEKDKIKYSHFAYGFSAKHSFCFPYSEEAANFVLLNAPSGKYLGLAFTDETFKE